MPFTLSDGTVVSVRKRVGEPITEGDIRAVEEFNTMLKCQGCTQRAKCALNGCAHEMTEGQDDGS